MKIPRLKECLHYFDQFAMLENIRQHSVMVAQVAATLHNALAGNPHLQLPPREEVVAGALMHDIAKTPCLGTKRSHALHGQKICEELGYPELGEVVAEHVLLKDFCREQYAQGLFSTKELVFYADKRVMHDTVVSLTERQEYIIYRYGKGDRQREKQIRNNFSTAFILERYLFNYIMFSPQQLAENLRTIPELTQKEETK